jgi:hypothetical protein
VSISHNKFVILLKDGEPLEVWSGSTNVTEGGIYGHANVGHRIGDRKVAAAYLDYWMQISLNPSRPDICAFSASETGSNGPSSWLLASMHSPLRSGHRSRPGCRPMGQRRSTVSLASKSQASVPGPRALARRRATYVLALATVAPSLVESESESAEIAANPRASASFWALGVATHNVVPTRQAELRAADGQGSRVFS